MRRSPDLPSLVAGIVIAALGGLLLADSAGAVSLTFESFAPVAAIAVGAILLAVGLSRAS